VLNFLLVDFGEYFVCRLNGLGLRMRRKEGWMDGWWWNRIMLRDEMIQPREVKEGTSS
jgi:hypothetical protein